MILGSNASGSYTIRAELNSDSAVNVSGTATVTTSPPPPQYSLVVISGPGSGAPGDTLTFVVEVRRNGTATSGETVAFSVSPNDGNVTLNPTSDTTGNGGQTQTALTLGNNATGSYIITATNNGNTVTGTATVQTSPPDPRFSIVVVSGPGSGAPGDTLTFVVEVREDGTAAQGETVDFSITAGDGNATLGTPNPATTENNGQAQITITFGNNSTGAYIITATNNGQSVTGTATVTSGNGNGNGNGDGNGDSNGNGNGNSNNGGNNGGSNQQPGSPQRSEPESDEDRRFAFQLDLYAGWNFIHIPLEVTQVNGQSMSFETVGNLFQVLMPAHMYIHDGSCWMEVFEDSTQPLGLNQGVVVYMNAPLTVNLVGSPLPGAFSIERGLTFVGLPRQSASLRKISDFMTFYPKVCVVLVTVEGELYLVGRAGDSGDVRITGGQAFGIVAIEQYMTNFNGAAWGKVFTQ